MSFAQKMLALAFGDVIIGCSIFAIAGYLEFGLFWILSSPSPFDFYLRSAVYVSLTVFYVPLLAYLIPRAWRFPHEIWHGEEKKKP